MKKIIAFIIFVLVILPSLAATPQGVKTSGPVELEYETKDGVLIKSTLTFPQEKKDKYPLVVLLHSIGYSSQYWGVLSNDLSKAGFAVLKIDQRGHGQSIYDVNLNKRSWMYLSQAGYAKYPADTGGTINMLLAQSKKIFPDKIIFIGADIGASNAILTAKKMNPKPIGLVLMSVQTNFKGLYVPITLADLGAMPILAIASKEDTTSVKELASLKRFAQGDFDTAIYPSGGTGMALIKANSNVASDITSWCVQTYFNSVVQVK